MFDTVVVRRAGVRAARVAAGSVPSPGLVIPALAILALALLPLGYLGLRAIGADADALSLLVRPRTLEVLAGTILLSLTVAAGAAALGVPLGWLTARTDLPGRRLWTVLVLVPLAIPSYVTAFAFVSAFGPRGAIQGLLEPFGVARIPSLYGFPGAAIVLILATYPYVLLATRAGLARADRQLEEAARSLGDDGRAYVRRVVLPLLTPAIVSGVLLAVLYTLADFGAVAILRFDSLARAVYLQYQASFDRQLAAVLGLLLVAIALAVTVSETGLHRRAARTRTHDEGRRPATLVALGRWRWPALLFCGAVVAVALVLPAATVSWWLVRGIANGEPLLLLGDAALSSLAVGGGAAVVAVVLALPIATLAIRFRGPLARLVETGVYVPYAMPGIALALGVVFLAANLVPFLYQTLALLVLVYALRFLPEAVAPLRVSLIQASARLPEAARSLGRGRWSVFRTISLPLLRPGILAGGALVFLTTVKELPITLLLGPIGFETLATAIWGSASEGFYARAAGPAIVLMVISALSLGMLLRHEGRGS